MRVKIQRGSASIEIEADFDEVERVLDRWWMNSAAAEGDESPLGDELAAEPERKEPEKKKQRRAPRRVARAPSRENASSFDADAVVAQMKNDERYELFMQKVILVDRGRAQKVKLVSWFVGDTPLTSGDVHRVLQRLGVKIDLATVSRGISGDSKHDYIMDRSGPQPTYVLSLRGKMNFEQWLLDDARAA